MSTSSDKSDRKMPAVLSEELKAQQNARVIEQDRKISMKCKKKQIIMKSLGKKIASL